jgi:hypothetical protein
MNEQLRLDLPLSASAILGEANTVRGEGVPTSRTFVSPKGAIVICMCGWKKVYKNTWAGSYGAIAHQQFCPLVIKSLTEGA